MLNTSIEAQDLFLQKGESLNFNVISTGEPTYWPTDTNKTPDLDFLISSLPKGYPTQMSHVLVAQKVIGDFSYSQR